MSEVLVHTTMFPKVSVSLIKKHFCLYRKNYTQVRAFGRYIPFNSQILGNVQSAKHLGITITDNMIWGQHISKISLYLVSSARFFVLRKLQGISVRPKLENAALIKNPYFKTQINQTYKRFLQEIAKHK